MRAEADAKLAGAATRLKATYLHPFQMHGSIGSSCAVADVRGTNATVLSSTQAVYPLRSTTAMVLGVQPQDVDLDRRIGLEDGPPGGVVLRPSAHEG